MDVRHPQHRGYTFAAGLFFLGRGGWWVLAAMAVTTFVVMGLMNLTGYAGQRLGVPYPVLARLSFGVRRWAGSASSSSGRRSCC